MHQSLRNEADFSVVNLLLPKEGKPDVTRHHCFHLHQEFLLIMQSKQGTSFHFLKFIF